MGSWPQDGLCTFRLPAQIQRQKNICVGEDIEPKAFSMSHSFLSIDTTIEEICNKELYTK